MGKGTSKPGRSLSLPDARPLVKELQQERSPGARMPFEFSSKSNHSFKESEESTENLTYKKSPLSSRVSLYSPLVSKSMSRKSMMKSLTDRNSFVTQYQIDLLELKKTHQRVNATIQPSEEENDFKRNSKKNRRGSSQQGSKINGNTEWENDRKVIAHLKIPFEQELLSPRLIFSSPREEIYKSQQKFLKENRKMHELEEAKKKEKDTNSQQKMVKTP